MPLPHLFLLLLLALSSLSITHSMANFLVQNVQNALKSHQAGDTAEALKLYEDCLTSSNRKSLNANIVSTLASNCGSIYMSSGQYENAAKKFELALEATPEKVESHYNYAVLLNSKLGDNGKALKHCAKAMKLDSNFYKAYHLMGNIMQDLGRPEKADDYFIKAETIAKSLGIDDSSISQQKSQSVGFKLESIWMFQHAEVNRSYEIPLPVSQQELLQQTSLTVTCLSVRPLVFEIPLLLSNDECEHIKLTATSKLEISHVMGSKVSPSSEDSLETTEEPEPYRSSYNAWLPLDPVLESLQERISLITTLPRQFISLKSEELQVVKYEAGGQFKMHHDSSAFNPRLLTALVYLQGSEESKCVAQVENDTCSLDNSAGGETVFPFCNTTAQDSDDGELRSSWTVDDALLHLSKKSENNLKKEGLAVKPAKGKAIIFFNHLSDGSVDPMAVHSGSKLNVGTKWVANYWVKMDMKSLNDIPASSSS
jgi:prolyl 4-hydroxylase